MINLSTDNNPFTVIKNDIRSFYHTGIKVYSSPLNFNKSDWIIAGSILAATSLSFTLDNKDKIFWAENHTKYLDKISSVGYFYGGTGNAIILSSALYLGGIISGDERIHKAGKHLMEGLAYAGITTTIIKSIMGRSRPYTNDGPFRFKPFQFNTSHTSLPSGHITVAFTISSVLANEINNSYASAALYSLAASTFLQRMYDDKHWLSDSILAAAIGYFIGNSVAGYDEESTANNISISPCLIRGEPGLSFVLQF